MSNLLLSKNECVSNVETEVSLCKVAVVVYDGEVFIGSMSFHTDGTKENLDKNLNLEWNDKYNYKTEYIIRMSDINTERTKTLVVNITEGFQNVVSINKSYIGFEINSLYKKDWSTYTLIER